MAIISIKREPARYGNQNQDGGGNFRVGGRNGLSGLGGCDGLCGCGHLCNCSAVLRQLLFQPEYRGYGFSIGYFAGDGHLHGLL